MMEEQTPVPFYLSTLEGLNAVAGDCRAGSVTRKNLRTGEKVGLYV